MPRSSSVILGTHHLQLISIVLVVGGLASCGASQHPDAEEPSSPVVELVSESLPIATPTEAAMEEPAVEELAVDEPAMEEPDAAAGMAPCSLDPDAPPAAAQLRDFERWLLDQSVGRQLTIEQIDPRCGDREGFLVVHLELTGQVGGLQSLSRALPLYWPGATWSPGRYERFGGEMLRLRLDVEVCVPTGIELRPRCEWDPAGNCDSSDP